MFFLFKKKHVLLSSRGLFTRFSWGLGKKVINQRPEWSPPRGNYYGRGLGVSRGGDYLRGGELLSSKENPENFLRRFAPWGIFPLHRGGIIRFGTAAFFLEGAIIRELFGAGVPKATGGFFFFFFCSTPSKKNYFFQYKGFVHFIGLGEKLHPVAKGNKSPSNFLPSPKATGGFFLHKKTVFFVGFFFERVRWPPPFSPERRP